MLRTATGQLRLLPGFQAPLCQPMMDRWLVGSYRAAHGKRGRKKKLCIPYPFKAEVKCVPFSQAGPAAQTYMTHPPKASPRVPTSSEETEASRAPPEESPEGASASEPASTGDASEAQSDSESQSPPPPGDGPNADSQSESGPGHEEFKEPVVLYRLRNERFKIYYIGILVGLLPIPLYLNERFLFSQRPRMKARHEARKKVLNEPDDDPEEQGRYVLCYAMFVFVLKSKTVISEQILNAKS